MSGEIRPRDANLGAFDREYEAHLVDDLRLRPGPATSRRILRRGREAVVQTTRGGAGSAPIRESLDRRAHAAHRIFVLPGHRIYYPRFGVSAERAGEFAPLFEMVS